MKTNPGLGVAAAEWIARQDPMLDRGRHRADQRDAESRSAALEPGAPDRAGGQRHLSAGEPRLDEVAAQRAHEFALMVQPLKLVGATGSTVAPVAIR